VAGVELVLHAVKMAGAQEAAQAEEFRLGISISPENSAGRCAQGEHRLDATLHPRYGRAGRANRDGVSEQPQRCEAVERTT
jgi:hypothetical protein